MLYKIISNANIVKLIGGRLNTEYYAEIIVLSIK